MRKLQLYKPRDKIKDNPGLVYPADASLSSMLAQLLNPLPDWLTASDKDTLANKRFSQIIG